MIITADRVIDELLQLRDIHGNRCHTTRAEVRKSYGVVAIANRCTERSIEPSQYSRAFWDIVSRYSY